MLILIAVGYPGVLLLSVTMLYASYFVLHDKDSSVGLLLDAILGGLLGVLAAWIFFEALRGWRSIFTPYLLDQAGVRVGSNVTDRVLSWGDLRFVRYRRLLGQLELRFETYPRLVILYNVDMDRNRMSLKTAMSMIEEQHSTPIRHSFL